MDRLPVYIGISLVGGFYGFGAVFAAIFFCFPLMIYGKATREAHAQGIKFGSIAAYAGLCFGMWVSSQLRFSVYILSYMIFSVISFIVATNFLY